MIWIVPMEDEWRTKMKILPVFIMIIALGVVLEAQILPDTNLADSSLAVQLGIDERKNLHAVWVDLKDWGIYHTLFDSMGHVVRSSERISDEGQGQGPRIAVGRKYCFVVWTRPTPLFNSYIMGQLLTGDGLKVGKNVWINDSYGDAERGSPDVAVMEDSTFIIVWAGNGPQTPSPNSGVYGQIVQVIQDSLSFVGRNFLLSDYVGESYYPARSTVRTSDGESNFLALWVDDRLGNPNIFGRLFNSDGTPADSSFLISDKPDFTYAWSPAIVANPRGGFDVFYSAGGNEDIWHIYMRRIEEGGLPLDSSQKVSDGEVSHASEVSVDASSNGAEIVVWEGVDGNSSTTIIMAQRFGPEGGMIEKNFRLSFFPEDTNHWYPSVSLNGGRMYTGWQSGLPPSVWMNIVDFYNPPVNATEGGIMKKQNFQLVHNYPNPFNESTTIKFTIPMRLHAELTIFDLRGRRVVTLVEGAIDPGAHQVNWNGTGPDQVPLGTGIYIVRLLMGEHVQVHKMLLLR